MPSYQKLQCRLTAPYILVACNGGLQRKKINTDDHLSMCSCSGGTALDKAVKFRISWSAWCTFSRGEQIRGYVPRENEHRGAHFRGWCTNSLANLCTGARLRGGNEYAVTPDIRIYPDTCKRSLTLYMLARHYTTGGTRPPIFPQVNTVHKSLPKAFSYKLWSMALPILLKLVFTNQEKSQFSKMSLLMKMCRFTVRRLL